MKNNAATPVPATFVRDGHNLRTVMIDGNPWFVAKDICDQLGLTNATVVIQSLENNERSKFNLGRQGETWVVNESGMYAIILQSRKPEARALRVWITSEVIPALMRDGVYVRTEMANAMLEGISSIERNGQKWFSLRDIAVHLGYDDSMHRHWRKGLAAQWFLVEKGDSYTSYQGMVLIVGKRKRVGINNRFTPQAIVPIFQKLWPGLGMPEMSSTMKRSLSKSIESKNHNRQPRQGEYLFNGQQIRTIISELGKPEIDRDTIMRILID